MIKPMLSGLLLAGLLLGCAQEPDESAASTVAVNTEPSVDATVAPTTAAPDLSGDWDFSVDVGEHVTNGQFSLQREIDAYSGTLTPQGTNTLTVQSLKLSGDQVEMIVQSAEGRVIFTGLLDAAGRAMSGKVTYTKARSFR